jgi:hypothetical protein
MRKLAHIEEVAWIKPIEGADKIELCGILGWQCVVAKSDKFKVGDKVVYIEIDSIVPPKPEFEFLAKRKYRVKTIKLRGEISQGLVVPLSILGKNRPINLKEGDDVTDLLGVKKYLSPSEREEIRRQLRKIENDKNKIRKFMMRYSWFRRLFLSRTERESFPFWVSKTDEERIQNIPQVIEQFKDKEVYITEKIDYQSVTFTGKYLPRFNGLLGRILPKKYKFVVCSRNLVNNDKNSLYWQIAKKYGIEDILRKHPMLTIQGEQGDTKVQGNKYGLMEPTFWVFNIINHENGYKWGYEEIKSFCSANGIPIVPLLYRGKLSKFGSTVNDFVELSKGKSLLAPIHREGIVVRCIESGCKLLSFKAINPDFLLKYD